MGRLFLDSPIVIGLKQQNFMKIAISIGGSFYKASDCCARLAKELHFRICLETCVNNSKSMDNEMIEIKS
jgi:hypothetical protein